jgi:hypothetical protein
MTSITSTGFPSNIAFYQKATTNPIGVTAATSTNIGYLATNKTQLEVVGQLTSQDPTDMYNFTFQNDGNVTLTLKNLDGDSRPRIQLLDQSGTRILADSGGTTSQKDAYNQLIAGTGLKLAAGQYIVKTDYALGASKAKPIDYTMQLTSGSFTSDYRTLASSTTVEKTLLAGGSLGYNSLSATASMLTNISSGTSLDIFGTLALFGGTNIFA